MGSRLEKNSDSVRKRIESHTFENEEGDEYEGSKFGGFPEYFRRKKLKLQNLDVEVRAASGDKPQIFKGIVAHVNGYTQPSLNDLHRLIVSHGGGFMQYLDGKTTVTHIIAANLTPKKAVEFKKYRMVKPAWVVDSVAAGKLLPWDSYRILDEGAGQRLLGFEEGKVVSQVNVTQRGYREQTNTSWYTSQVKNVAGDIDDEDGAHFPSMQAVAFNGQYSNIGSQNAVTPMKDDIGDPDSSAGFDVTSSLEDALKDAVAVDQFQNIPDIEESAPLRLFDEPDVSDMDVEDQDGPTSPQPLPNPLKRLHEPDLDPPSRKTKVLTAEEHNAILLADPHMRKSSTANPDFIKQYYAESRLHHLSAWKADLKSRFQRMAAERSASQKHPFKRKPGARRYIMHVDFDSFFCAVSLRSAPEYIDKPAVVAHGSGTGSEIASCNYPARAFGVKNGMWMKNALKMCPDIKVLPYDFPAYEEASKGFYEAILEVEGVVQSVSVDEALVDITGLVLPAGGSDGVGNNEGGIWREQEKADDIGNTLRIRIKEKTGCEVSIGIGSNILLAKVALRKAKPAGQHQINPEEVLDFIGELSVQNLPGVAYSIGGKLEEIGVTFVKDVRQLTKERLMTVLGPKTGEKIWDYSRGIDKTEVGVQEIRKSVSAEVNWGIRFITQLEAEEFVQNLCNELQRRLLNERVKGKQVTMKIMRKAVDAPLDPPKHLGHGKCDTFNKSVVLGVATNSAEVIGREAISVLRSYGFSPGELRGLGVQMTKLEPLKASNALPDGSQRRITFGAIAAAKPIKQDDDPIDDPQTPRKPKTVNLNRGNSGFETPSDPIDESITPQKPRSLAPPRFSHGFDAIDDIDSPKKTKSTSGQVHPAAAIARANASDQSAKKVLNLTGTQFIVPSQIDPAVLAELPQDIRSKLIAQSKSRPLPPSRPESPAQFSKSRSHSPAPFALPSQLDPEVFEALPEDMKAEILASYTSHPYHLSSTAARGQSLLPQSPHKPRVPSTISKQVKRTPTKPKRGRPVGWRAKPKEDPHSNLKQSNFVTPAPFAREEASSRPDSRDGVHDDETNTSDILDPDFLSALPPDVRAEVLSEHRRKLIAKKGGLVTSLPLSKKPKKPDLPIVQQKLRLPKKEKRPTFTTRELSTLEELRGTLREWFEEFREEGPIEGDVGALERYLVRVVGDERDLEKVVGVVRWLRWLVDENPDGDGDKAWRRAIDGVERKIQEAVRERGMGVLVL